MLAVVKASGKQYKVAVGDFMSVEKLAGEIGAKIEFSDVLMIEDNGEVKVGTPLVSGATVTASVVDQKKRKTVLIFKKSRRKNYRRKNGHRQPVTILKVENIRH
ncbi:MAG: 50S ribosomal protein L21 [Holosporaceae bacterium]|nr:50S ribosomal protein L21 [Holosporaceae bacterium]